MSTIRLTAGETWSMFQCPQSAEPMLALLMLLGLCGHEGEMELCTTALPRDWYRPRRPDERMTWAELDAAVATLMTEVA